MVRVRVRARPIARTEPERTRTNRTPNLTRARTRTRVNHSANFGLGLNGDARTTATSLRAAPPGTCVSLRGASAALLGRSPLRVLLSLAGGELLQLSLGADGRGVQAMELVRLASSVPAATLAVLPSSLAPHARL